MSDARHDPRLGGRDTPREPADVIEMGPIRPDPDDLEAIELGPAHSLLDDAIEILDDLEIVEDPLDEPSLLDDVPEADAWDQLRLADPDAPVAPAQGPVSDWDHGVPAADAWEQAQLTDRFDDY